MTLKIEDIVVEMDRQQMDLMKGGMWGAIINAAAQFSNTKQGGQLHSTKKKSPLSELKPGIATFSL